MKIEASQEWPGPPSTGGCSDFDELFIQWDGTANEVIGIDSDTSSWYTVTVEGSNTFHLSTACCCDIKIHDIQFE